MTTAVSANGSTESLKEFAQPILEAETTVGYIPTLPVMGMYGTDSMPIMWLRLDIEMMLWHPTVRRALSYFKGGIAGAEFWGGPNPADPEDEQGVPICPEDERVGIFVKEQCEKFWDRGVPGLQHAYEYGWLGAENVYDAENSDGLLRWDKLEVFRPSDTYLLTRDKIPVGVRVKNIRGVENNQGIVDLWMAKDCVPAKGMWYVHQPRYNRYYGQSQLMGAWRPWKRLAGNRDAAEGTIDGGFYRFAYQGPIGRYPTKDMQGPSGIPNTTQNSDGNPMRYARDIMRQMCEQYKAGAAIGMPNTRDKNGNYEWDLTLPTSTLAGITGLLDYAHYLEDQITEGIGVPKELLQAGETGSGYSGRRIPMEAFLDTQQQIADALLHLFTEQVLKPLVKWNFPDAKTWQVKVKRLIKTKTAASESPEDKQPQNGQQPSPTQAMMPQNQPTPTPAQPYPQSATPAAFSNLLMTDRVREIARRALQRVV